MNIFEHLLITFYFLVNTFLCGIYYGQEIYDQKICNSKVLGHISIIFLILLFGSLIVPGFYIAGKAIQLWEWINSRTQLEFWLKEIFIPDFSKRLTQEKLQAVYNEVARRKEMNSPLRKRDKLFILAANRAMRKNNFIPEGISLGRVGILITLTECENVRDKIRVSKPFQDNYNKLVASFTYNLDYQVVINITSKDSIKSISRKQYTFKEFYNLYMKEEQDTTPIEGYYIPLY
jgi:hypothetical protein